MFYPRPDVSDETAITCIYAKGLDICSTQYWTTGEVENLNQVKPPNNLYPVQLYTDPFRMFPNILVACEQMPNTQYAMNPQQVRAN